METKLLPRAGSLRCGAFALGDIAQEAADAGHLAPPHRGMRTPFDPHELAVVGALSSSAR